MLKVAAIASLGLGFALCVGNVAAGEMTMPASAAFAPVGASSGEVETTTVTTRTQTSSTGGMRESGAHDDDTEVTPAARVHMQPDSVATARADSVHAAVGTDATTTPGAVAPAHKIRHGAHWQSLLPGVMK